MTVPIATSPGRSGFGPQPSLSYDSGSGNGLFGFGWSLALPSITRKTDKGLPRYQDGADKDSDVFILSGAEDLVPVYRRDIDGTWVACHPGYERDAATFWVRDSNGRFVVHEDEREGYRVRRYRPRIEGLFARVERWSNTESGETHWRSISKDNVTTLYGTADESRIRDPRDPLRVFCWLICESHDDKGNAILYRYQREDSTDVDTSQAHERNRTDETRSSNRYIKRILYCNRTPRRASEDLKERRDWLFEVVFDYGEHDPERPTPGDDGNWLCRHDPFSSCRAGFELRTYRLCQRVLMFHHFPNEPDVGRDCLVRSTDFAYRSNRGDPEDVKRGHPVASFIASMTQSGYRRLDDGSYLKKSLPPLEFEYSEAIIHDELHEVERESVENLPEGVDGTRYQWADLDGEGLQSALTQQGNAWYYKRNVSAELNGADSAARFEPLEQVAQIPAAAALGQRGQQLLDLAGDGQLDLVQLGGPTPGYYERTDDGRWSPFTSFASLPNLAWDHPNVRFADVTGDGRAGALIAEDDALIWYRSLGEVGFSAGERVTQPFDEDSGPRLVFADGTQSVYMADMSGDGLPDLVRIRNSGIDYWPNCGFGRWGNVDLYAVPSDDEAPADIDGLAVTLPGQQQSVPMSSPQTVGRLRAKTFTANLEVADEPEDAEWTLSVSAKTATAFRDTVEDIVLLCHYAVAEAGS